MIQKCSFLKKRSFHEHLLLAKYQLLPDLDLRVCAPVLRVFTPVLRVCFRVFPRNKLYEKREADAIGKDARIRICACSPRNMPEQQMPATKHSRDAKIYATNEGPGYTSRKKIFAPLHRSSSSGGRFATLNSHFVPNTKSGEEDESSWLGFLLFSPRREIGSALGGHSILVLAEIQLISAAENSLCRGVLVSFGLVYREAKSNTISGVPYFTTTPRFQTLLNLTLTFWRLRAPKSNKILVYSS